MNNNINNNSDDEMVIACMEQAHKEKMYQKYDNIIYLLKEIAGYCDNERDIKKIKKYIKRVKKKQAKYYTSSLLDAADYENFIKTKQKKNK